MELARWPLESVNSRIQVRVRSFLKRKIKIRTVSIRHGSKFYGLEIVQVKESLICPEHLECNWCQTVVNEAASNIDAETDIFYT